MLVMLVKMTLVKVKLVIMTGEDDTGEGYAGDYDSGEDDTSEVGSDVCTQLSGLLASVGESPIIKRTMGTRSYSEEKMKSIDSTIRKRLGLEPSKKVKVEFNEMMDSLKPKFNNCLKKSEKVQILSYPNLGPLGE